MFHIKMLIGAARVLQSGTTEADGDPQGKKKIHLLFYNALDIFFKKTPRLLVLCVELVGHERDYVANLECFRMLVRRD